VLAAAADWHVRLRDGTDADWAAFVGWLEADPRHSAAYDLAEDSHAAMVVEAFPVAAALPANDGFASEQGNRRWWPWAAAGGVVAFLAAVALPLTGPRPDRYEIASGRGEQRTVQIADGGSVALNGSTRVMLDRNDPRFAELVSGEATFTVRHDERRPFTVTIGNHRVQDAGTIFNLVKDGDALIVEVAEGEVVYDPSAQAVALRAGQTLRAGPNMPPRIGRTDPGSVAGWRRRRLSYSNAPLGRVVADLSRTLGIHISLEPGLDATLFTGSIEVRGDAGGILEDLAGSVGLRAISTKDGWLVRRQ